MRSRSHCLFSSNLFVVALVMSLVPGTWGQPSGAIQLADNTEKGAVISESVLTPTQQRHYGSGKGVLPGRRTYSLLQSPASRYFSLDSRKGQLRTARPVDRDLLCPEAGLCCQPSLLPDYRSCAGTRTAGYPGALLTVGTRNDKVGASQTQLCSFNLSVSVVSAEGQQPTVYDVPVYVCEENDHAPEFKVSPSSTGKSVSNWPRYDSSIHQSKTPPVHVVEVSESVSVGHRIRLPTAEDIDAPPFNVQRYELVDAADHSNSFDTSLLHRKTYFELETLREAGSPELGQSGLAYSHGPTSVADAITGLELVVRDVLDREKTSLHYLTVLAVDGGQPARTGTLHVQVTVIDANDHVPVFSRSVYEATVNEGETTVFGNRPIVQVNATDRDEGENARILYDWSDAGANQAVPSADESRMSREAMAAAPPSFWFRLDNRTGAIYLRRPLDYELKRQYRFQVLAYNPLTGDLKDRRLSSRAQALPSATTNVIIQVHNLDDEPPLIVIDYVNVNQRQFKEVKENLPSPYFIAFVTVNDPDLGGSSAMLPTNLHRAETSGPSVDCQLDTHQESYRLERQAQVALTSSSSLAYDQWSSAVRAAGTGGSKVRFTLVTRRPLDREQSAEDHILIRCWDSGIPPKTATAEVKVKVLDENDCQPVVKVFGPPIGPGGAMSRGGGSAGSSTAPIDPWSKENLSRWLTEHLLPYDNNGWWHSPLLLAYLANIQVYTLHVSENQPVGTVVARIQAIDRDAGENGRVTFDMPPSTASLSLPLVNEPTTVDALRDYGQALEGLSRTVKLLNSQKSLDYFKLHPSTGELSILQELDREDAVSDEDNSGMLEQLFLFVKASDHGSPEANFTVLLLQIRIIDVNDNPPIFCFEEMHFEVGENLPAPAVVGEVLLRDRDIHSHRCDMMVDHAGLPLSSSFRGGLPAVGSPSGSTGASRKSLCTQLTLRIDPGHGRRSIPFVLYCTKQGRFFINTTQVLDRELEAVFKFRLVATDADSLHTHLVNRDHRLGERPVHTAMATVLITVLDTNDNKPEIIFPSPATSNSTTHRVSCHELAGYDILHVNAQDRDATESNRKLNFDLIPEIPGENLFTIDQISGILRTRRRLTKDDMGEHRIKVVVRDKGRPSLEAYVNIRLLVDDSNPDRIYGHAPGDLNSINYPSVSGQKGSPGGSGRRDSGSPDRFGPHANYPGGLSASNSAELTNIVLVVIMIFILIPFLVILGLCFYLRHKRNTCRFLPDVCGLCLLPQVIQPSGDSSGDEKERSADAAASVAGYPPGNRRFKKKLEANGKAGELDALTTGTFRGRPSNETGHLLNGDCTRTGQPKHQHRDPKHQHPDGELMTSLLSDPPSSCGGGCLSPFGQGLSPNHMLVSQMNMQDEFYAGVGNGSGYPLLGSKLTDCCDPRTTVMCSPLPSGEPPVFSPVMGVRNTRFPSSMTTATTPVDACLSAGTLSSSVYYLPGNTSGVKIPDVADQAEMMHRRYVDYCRSMQSPGGPQPSHNRSSIRPPCDLPSGYHTSPGHMTTRHAYNTGLPQPGHMGPQQRFSSIHHPPRNSDAFYFNGGSRILVPSNGGFLSPVFGQAQQPHRHPHQHSFVVDPCHEMSFRPIRDETHMYQRIDPCEMYSTGKHHPTVFGEEQMGRRQPEQQQQQQPHPQQHKLGLLTPCGEAVVGHHEREASGDLTTVLWRSDPSICNQPVQPRLSPVVGDNLSEKDPAAGCSGQGRQNLCSSPPLLLDECHHQHHHRHRQQQPHQQQQTMTRSKSMQRQRPHPPSAGSTTNNNGSGAVTAAYYSLLRQPPPLPGESADSRPGRHLQQQMDTLPLVDLGDLDAASDQSGAVGSSNRVVIVADGDEESVATTTENYAVSFPKVQASFV